MIKEFVIFILLKILNYQHDGMGHQFDISGVSRYYVDFNILLIC